LKCGRSHNPEVRADPEVRKEANLLGAGSTEAMNRSADEMMKI